MEMIEYVKLVTAFIVSIGGSSVVIIALSLLSKEIFP